MFKHLACLSAALMSFSVASAAVPDRVELTCKDNRPYVRAVVHSTGCIVFPSAVFFRHFNLAAETVDSGTIDFEVEASFPATLPCASTRQWPFTVLLPLPVIDGHWTVNLDGAPLGVVRFDTHGQCVAD